ncbi:ABC transporter substrate-binding protein [Anaeromassilibacillus sp. An200]|uniref:ABC transporter substrate-binding protein n=1 Tax=Anaeromassilibacillus sp. An200 TaxID=1965587 RepID=UPI000B391916|nr:extracellular solute-binding protein [Anaeromassilibacillus sp. An200]OUP12401.1 ABC transporter substrate-binding protein [Anaeromassilibacillus sp. An200]
MKAKKILASVLAGLMLLATAGCNNNGGGSTASGSTASGGSSKGVIEVSIPSYKTGENVGAVFFEPQVERFNEKYEGQYKINLETVPQDGFGDRLKQLAQQNKLPVLVQGGDLDWILNVVIPNGLAWDMTDWLEESGLLERAVQDSVDYNKDKGDGKIYTIPKMTVRPTGFYYNTAMWNPEEDLSSLTMDELVTLLGDQKIAFSTAENGWVSALFLTAFIANQEGGVELLQAGADEKITDFSDPIFVNAVASLQQLLQNNAASNSIGAAYADAANAFMSGQAAVIANGPWMSSEFNESNSANWSNGFDGANVKASLFPGNVGIENNRAFGEWWISASASEEEIELAKAFLEFISNPEELEAYLLAEGGDAPNIEYSEDFKEKQAETQVLADLAADTTEETVYVPCILDVIPNSVANTEFGKLLPSLANGTYTPEEFCDWMTQKSVEASAE